MKKHATLLAIFITFLCSPPTTSWAQQPTATVKDLKGTVLVTRQGQEPIHAVEGTVLQAGDIIELSSGASAALSLSDDSEIQLGENTRLDIAVLMQSPQGARTSGLKLLYGRLRAFLSGNHQKEGSSFDIETPNAQVGVKFSQPDVEVEYDRVQKITIARAYTVSVRILNRVTKAEIKEMPSGHQAEIHDDYIIVTKISGTAEWREPAGETDERKEAPQTQDSQSRASLLLESRYGMMGATSSTPLSAAIAEPGAPTTSQIPPPESRRVSPESRIEPMGFTFTITRE